MSRYRCTRFPRLAKLSMQFTLLNESIDLEKFGGEFTDDEIAEMILSFGETNNLIDGGWILPGGEVLDFNRSSTLSNNAIRHSSIYVAFSPERKATLEKHMSPKDLLYSDDSIAIDVCLAAGFIRYHFFERKDDAVAYFSLEKKPT